MRLFYGLHMGQQALALYRKALPEDFEIILVVGPPLPNVKGGGMSSRYTALAQTCKAVGGGSVMKGLAKKYPPKMPLDAYDAIWGGSWSAGFAFWRELPEADMNMLAGLVLLDSEHSNKDADGTAGDALLAWAVKWAKRAQQQNAVFWIGHTDVQTEPAVASTTASAVETVRLAGGISGYFNVRAFDTSKNPATEHENALNVWGPGFIAEAIEQLPSDTSRTPLPWRNPLRSRGDRAVEWALTKLGTKEEPPGSNTGPEIKAWLAPCERDVDNDGDMDNLGLKAAEWCSAFACAADRAVQLAHELPSHPYFAAGLDFQKWAIANDRWRSKDRILAGDLPRKGELAILKRGSLDWQRHVCRVELVNMDMSYLAVGGNEGNTVKETLRRFTDADFLGTVIIDVSEPLVVPVKPEEKQVDLDLVRALQAKALDEIARGLVFGP